MMGKKQPDKFNSWDVLSTHEIALKREIITYCTPLDVYHLSIATKSRFISTFTNTVTGPNREINRHIRLLQCSHLNSVLVAALARKVRKHEEFDNEHLFGPPIWPNITLERILPPLKKDEKPGVIMSGALPMQAVTNYDQLPGNQGPSWSPYPPGVIDLFCIQSHVERVRSVLINEFGMICCMYGNVNNPGSSHVHHIEQYAHRPRSGYSPTRLDHAMCDSYRVLGLGNLPFDESLDLHFVLRLFVGKRRVIDPYSLIESFDINVCRVAFDGLVFTLPWESNIFARRARLMTYRAAMQTFLDSHLHGHPLAPCYIRYEADWDDWEVVNTFHRVWKFMARQFDFKGLPDLFVHLHNHPRTECGWLVLDPTRLRSITPPELPPIRIRESQCAYEYACPNLCGRFEDTEGDYDWHLKICLFDPLDWPNALATPSVPKLATAILQYY